MLSESSRFLLPDGRALAYSIEGDAHGAPVIFFHGFPGSKRQGCLVSRQAVAKNIKLICFDRPGMGQSSPDMESSLASVSKDANLLMKHLGHSSYGVMAVSCGASFALRHALDYPDQVRSIGLFSGVGPCNVPQITTKQHPMLRLLFRVSKKSKYLAYPMLSIDSLFLRHFPELGLKAVKNLLSAPDKALLNGSAEVRDTFLASLVDAYANGVKACAHEISTISRQYDFSLDRLLAKVYIYQAVFDHHVPQEVGQYLFSVLPNAEYFACEDDGHLSVSVRRAHDYFDRHAALIRN